MANLRIVDVNVTSISSKALFNHDKPQGFVPGGLKSSQDLSEGYPSVKLINNILYVLSGPVEI